MSALLSGCIGGTDDGGQDEPVVPTADTGQTPSSEEAWQVEGSIELGWIAGVGAQPFVGDLFMGIRSHDTCPSAAFYVPGGGASAVEIDISVPDTGEGAGLFDVAIGTPEAVTFLSYPISEMEYDEDDPPAGIWSLEIKPRGATAAQTIGFQVSLQGEGSAPVELTFRKDRDCIW